MNSKLKIYSQDWLALHPYTQSIPTDLYFTQLANKVIISLNHTLDKAQAADYLFLTEGDQKKLSCIFTAYFEDLVSETNLWNAFVNYHLKQTGSYLPFFNSNDYQEGEPNVCDLQFLTWHYFSQLHPEIPFSPLNALFEQIAKEIFSILDEEYETAPANEKLYQFIHRDAEATLQDLSNITFWLITESFLFSFNSLELEKEFKEAEGAAQDYEMQENMAELINAIVTDFTFNQVTEFHQLRGNQWLAQVLSEDHPLYDDLMQMGKKKNGYFVLAEQGEELTQFKHVATEKIISVNNNSLQGYPKELLQEGIIIFAGLVEWKNTWSFVGDLRGYESDDELISEIKGMTSEIEFFEQTLEVETSEETLATIEQNIEQLRQEYPEDEELDLFWSLFYDEEVPYDNLKDLIQRKLLPAIRFPENQGEELLHKNLDFVLAYYKRY